MFLIKYLIINKIEKEKYCIRKNGFRRIIRELQNIALIKIINIYNFNV